MLRINWVVRPMLLVFILTVSGSFIYGQAEPALQVGMSGFRLLASGVVYRGISCQVGRKSERIAANSRLGLEIGNNLYYDRSRFIQSLDEGFAAEKLKEKTCRLYPMFALAETAGWLKNAVGDSFPNGINGLFLSHQNLWMGTNGLGLAVFDTKLGTWSRYDTKAVALPGDQSRVVFADDDYVFVMRGEYPNAMLHIYSVARNKWLVLKAVPTEDVLEYGSNARGGMVQVFVDHRQYSTKGYLPIDWTFLGLDGFKSKDGRFYRFELDFLDSKTIFQLNRRELANAFRSQY